MKLVKLLSVLLFLAAPPLVAAPLRCGFRSADISTQSGEHCTLAGFAARNGLSTDVHIPLKTSALVVTDGRLSVCMISNDLMEISPDLSDSIRTAISLRSGLQKDRILLHCIHTHSAPRFGGSAGAPGGTNHIWRERVLGTIVDNAVAVIKDEASYREFRLETAVGKADIAWNRCDPENGPVDPSLYAARLVGMDGKPICAFYNIACHPVCMGPKSLAVSSDYSGVARSIIEPLWECEVFQFSGAAGNMDPDGGPADVAKAEAVGAALAESLKALRFHGTETSGVLKFTSGIAQLPYRVDRVTPEAVKAHADSLAAANVTVFPRFAEDVRGWEKEILERFETGTVPSKLEFRLEAVEMDGVVFFFSQGEPFCEYQQEARRAFPDKTVFFAGYTNGQNSYLPSELAFRVKKGYEYEIDQMHVYIKAPYPLSPSMPKVYSEAVRAVIGSLDAAPKEPSDPRYGIIPAPRKLVERDGWYSFKGEPKIVWRTSPDIPEEGYVLDIGKKRIVITASTETGRFYAMQTLYQLLPAEIYSGGFGKKRWKVPCCLVEDSPEYPYRGMQLDCGRWFFQKEDVKRFIDVMAMHKMNMFHWHLTEDQGWRIEIKKYPRLTEVGAWRRETAGYDGPGDGTPHGGFYTQDDVREIVAYAAERHVTVIPEIELPGHSSAAIAAYPWLSCIPDQPKEVDTRWGVREDVYCPSPETFRFLEDVFDEVLGLFPSKYYHIGGDEVPRDAWLSSGYCARVADSLGLSGPEDLQYYFVAHFDSLLSSHGKTVIGWDDILDGSFSKNTVVMSYRGHAPAKKAMENGMRTILCPNRWCYYDNMQDEVEDNPKNQEIFTTLRKAYNYDFRDIIDKETLASGGNGLLGFQACLWTEHIPTVERLEYQTYPREACIAETGWTPLDSHDWQSFRERMPKEFSRLGMKGVKPCLSYYDVIINMNLESPYPRQVELELDYPYAEIHFTLDGSEPTASSPLYYTPVTVDKGTHLRAAGFDASGNMVGEKTSRTF